MPLRAPKLNFRRKVGLIYISLLFASLLMAAIGLHSLHENLLDDRRSRVSQLVETAWSFTAHYHQLAEQGQLSESEAQAQALAALRSLRYGQEEYFWISDLDASLVMHPIQSHLEGLSQVDFRDSHGAPLFLTFVEIAQSKGAGFVPYHWPRPNSTEPVAKLSYVMYFPAWEWIIGSGIYLDDVEVIFRKDLYNYALTLGIFLLLTSLLLMRLLRVDARAFNTDRLMAAALGACAEAIMITDRHGLITWVNQAFEHLTGYKFSEIKGLRPADTLRSGQQNEAFYQQMWARLAKGETWSGELINRRKNGQLYYERMSITPVKDARGQINSYIAVKTDISERKRQQQYLEALASRDSLTGLLNRRVFLEQLGLYLEHPDTPAGVLMMLDLDHFKQINDQHGHLCGDQILKGFSNRLKANLRDRDLCGRIGGEEFVFLAPGVSPEQGLQIAERICHQVFGEAFIYEDVRLKVSVSIGLAAIYPPETDPLALLERADQALYQAKKHGRNCAKLVQI
ncbi:diguanylate cyclase [Nitrincola tapanii]|nr:diguanylate cyclase [Nitrincola tapanii]